MDGGSSLFKIGVGRHLTFVVAKSCHHRIHVEIVRPGAAEHWRLLAVEQCFGFLPCLVLHLGVHEGAFGIVTDVLFDEFFLLSVVNVVAIALHHAMHGRELSVDR